MKAGERVKNGTDAGQVGPPVPQGDEGRALTSAASLPCARRPPRHVTCEPLLIPCISDLSHCTNEDIVSLHSRSTLPGDRLCSCDFNNPPCVDNSESALSSFQAPGALTRKHFSLKLSTNSPSCPVPPPVTVPISMNGTITHQRPR